MKALVYDEELKLVNDYKKPEIQKNEALVKVTLCGICNTDKEITLGYMGYKGILGHEFTGIVEDIKSDNETDKLWIGKRVAGEINFGCKSCDWCGEKLERHCPNRSTLGIYKADGCFAEYVRIPVSNLIEIPNNVPDEDAVFVEPLAAALEILEQVHIKPFQKVLILGDGKLGLLTALALKNSNLNVTLVGKHENKLEIAKKQGIETVVLKDFDAKPVYDVVVEATGSVSGFMNCVNCTKPRGILVLKSTLASSAELNLAPVVVNEITIVGSRCGQFKPAMRMIADKKIDFKPLISKIYDFDNAIEAFKANSEKDTIKILMRVAK